MAYPVGKISNVNEDENASNELKGFENPQKHQETLPWELTSEMLSKFALRMKDSGYSEHIRQEIIEGGVKGYKNQLERDLKGVCTNQLMQYRSSLKPNDLKCQR